MSTLTPVKNGKWVVIWRGPDHDWQWEDFNTREEAIGLLDHLADKLE